MKKVNDGKKLIGAICILLLFFISNFVLNKDSTSILGKITTSNIILGDNNKSVTIKLYNLYTEKTETIDIEDYVKGVVIGEMPMEFDIEALKAQAVCARTYAYYFKMGYAKSTFASGHDADLASSHLYAQEWLPESKYSEKVGTGEKAQAYLEKLNTAVESTKGQIITYDGKPIVAYFFASSGGQTEDASYVFSGDVPYLKSVSSPEDEGSYGYKDEKTFTYKEFIEKINTFKTNLTVNNIESNVKIISRTVSGRVDKIQLGDKTITGVQLRSALSLKSTNMTISVSSGKVTINTVGYGHGVGMSQFGANYMAKNGSKYDEIIKHYYTGVEIEKIY